MGLWDSVNSIGFLYDRMFPYVSQTNLVKHIRHAISIDERRGKFKQYPFFSLSLHLGRCCPDDSLLGSLYKHSKSDESISSSSDKSRENIPSSTNHCRSDSLCANSSTEKIGFISPLWSPAEATLVQENETWVSLVLKTPVLGQTTVQHAYGYFSMPPVRLCDDVQELWFAGDHSDVGGGWPADDSGQQLSSISLRWLVSEAYKAGCLFSDGALSGFCADNPLELSLRAPTHDKLCVRWQCGEENDPENFVLQSQPNQRERKDGSQLQTVFWWLLELLPVFGYRLDRVTNRWMWSTTPNFGGSRVIPANVRFHWSAAWRLKNVSGYHPPNVTARHSIHEIDVSRPLDELDELKAILEANPYLWKPWHRL